MTDIRRAWVGLIAMLLGGRLALAEPSPPGDARAEAQALRDRGVAARARGDYATARTFFQEAYDRFPSPNLLFNLGVVKLKLGDEAGAAEDFSRFVLDAKDAPADATQYAHSSLGELARRLGRARITVRGAQAELELDGRALGRSPLDHAVWATPGEHRLVAKAADGTALVEPCTFVLGRVAECSIGSGQEQIPPRPVEPADRPATDTLAPTLVAAKPTPRPITRKAWFWVAIGGGVVVVGGAIALGVVLGTRDRGPSPTVGRVPAN